MPPSRTSQACYLVITPTRRTPQRVQTQRVSGEPATLQGLLCAWPSLTSYPPQCRLTLTLTLTRQRVVGASPRPGPNPTPTPNSNQAARGGRLMRGQAASTTPTPNPNRQRVVDA
eukprot:scaffold64280_cov33-Phaeocystis_antarctica.AAC.1